MIDEILVEELLIAYLKSNKKIKLAENSAKIEGSNADQYTIVFNVDKDVAFPISSLDNNQFSNFFKANQGVAS